MSAMACRSNVLIAGGGSAGTAAAIAAARAGASVRLIEATGGLGGNWTNAPIFSASDWRGKTPFMREFEARLEALIGTPVRRDLSRIHPAVEGSFFCSPEWTRAVLETLCVEAAVGVRFHTRVVEAQCDDTGAITGVATESKSGRETWHADVFVDATGDGDLGFLAGCGFDFGRPATGRTQPMSVHVLVSGVRHEDILPYLHWGRPPEDRGMRKSLADELARAGFRASYGNPGIQWLGHGLYGLGLNHEYGCGLDADALSLATLQGRAECMGAVVALRSLGGIWETLEPVASSAAIGVREGRRIHADYTVSRDDLIEGRRHADAVTRACFPVDVHATDASEGSTFSNEGVEAQPYDIPLRALIARDAANLLLAGRCIGGDFIAHASYRVIGNCVATGEAAGRLAATAALRGCLPRDVPYRDVLK